MLKKIKTTKIVIAVALVAIAMSILPGTSSAATLHNQRGSFVPACGSAGCPYGTGYLVPNRTYFSMSCWVNSSWRYGNYWTNRWFGGYVGGIRGRIFIPASYVYSQTNVPHCR